MTKRKKKQTEKQENGLILAQREVLNIYNQTSRIYQNLIETGAYMEYKLSKKTKRIWGHQAQQPQ